MAGRQARLRLEYAEWYPQIWAGEWHDAAWATEAVLEQQQKGSPAWGLEGRVLSETHFDFRGGAQAPREERERRRAIPSIVDPLDREESGV
jgi:hypothetical protein